MGTLRHAAAALAVAGGVLAGAEALADEVMPGDVVFEGERVVSPLTDAKPSGWRGVNLFIDEAGPNCVSCHENPDVAGTGLKGDVGPVIGLVAERYGEAEFRAILVDAKRVFGADTPMPSFYGGPGGPVLSAQEIEDLVAYLMELRRSLH